MLLELICQAPRLSFPAFSGTFNGNYKTISNWTRSRSSDGVTAPFGKVTGRSSTTPAYIANLGMLNVNINGSFSYENAGGLVGQTSGAVRILNSYSTGSIDLNGNGETNGGLVGRT